LNILSTQQSGFSSQNHRCYADNHIKLNETGIFKKCRKQAAMSLLLYFRTCFYRVPAVVRLLVAQFSKSNFPAMFVYWKLVIGYSSRPAKLAKAKASLCQKLHFQVQKFCQSNRFFDARLHFS
jgi:hypothetical protein